MWEQPWTSGPFRGWPCSVSEENQFLKDAKRHTSKNQTLKHKLTLSDVIALSDSLREGATFLQATEFLPGVSAASLVAAHSLLSKHSKASCTAWDKLTQEPNFSTLISVAEKTAVLFPVTVGNLARSIDADTSDEMIGAVTLRYTRFVELETTYAREVEQELFLPGHSIQRRIHLGKELSHPLRECLWMKPFYRPQRVTDLSPNRVADIFSYANRLKGGLG
jgi:hypothetical protein